MKDYNLNIIQKNFLQIKHKYIHIPINKAKTIATNQSENVNKIKQKKRKLFTNYFHFKAIKYHIKMALKIKQLEDLLKILKIKPMHRSKWMILRLTQETHFIPLF